MAEPVLVYDTKRPNREPFPIHPDLAKDARYMANKGWIIHEPVKKFEVTNLTAKPEATAPMPEAKPEPVSKKKGATNAD